MDREDVQRAVDSVAGWYHTIDLPHGVTTPGWFDLRPMVDRLPWPDVAGLRCLDVATFDGFLAFELERRGAGEVVATDIAGHGDWDHLPGVEQEAAAYHGAVFGQKGTGFSVAAECLGSKVRREIVNVYDLSPDRVGTFDVVVCGALLLHLRDPFRALEAIRSVCRGTFLSVEPVDVRLPSLLARTPALILEGSVGQWAMPTAAGHPRMLEVAGFRIERTVQRFVEPFGVSHPPRSRSMADRIRARWLGGHGVPQSAVLCRPAGASG